MSTEYAAAVVRVLSEHFPDLADPDTVRTLTQWIDRQGRDPQAGTEFIVDDPWSARWRLKPDSRDRRRVRLGYFPVIPRATAGDDLERTVNEALDALQAAG